MSSCVIIITNLRYVGDWTELSMSVLEENGWELSIAELMHTAHYHLKLMNTIAKKNIGLEVC